MRKLLAIGALATTTFACSWDYSIWIQRSPSADPLYRFEKDGKAGYIDANGKVVIPPRLPLHSNGGGEFHDGLLKLGLGDGKYVDRTGKVVFESSLNPGWEFSEGLAPAMKKGEDLWGYIDPSGKFVISPRFANYPDGYVGSFSEGLAAIEVKRKYGYIDRTGSFVIPPQYLEADEFRDGMARVVTDGPCSYLPDGPCGLFNRVRLGLDREDRSGAQSAPPCKFTYIDQKGRILPGAQFDGGRSFSEGIAPVLAGGVWGFIDKTGRVVVAPGFQDAWPFSSGMSRIFVNGLYGYADRAGKLAIPPQFKYADDFHENFAVVSDGNGAHQYIDTLGKPQFGRQFAVASPFFKGLAHVSWTDRQSGKRKYAYIDTKGHQVFEY